MQPTTEQWEPPLDPLPLPPKPRRTPSDRDLREFFARYHRELVKAGLPTSTRLTEFMQHLRAQGAMSLLSHLNRHDETKLSYDPDARLLDELAERLALGDEVIRKRSGG